MDTTDVRDRVAADPIALERQGWQALSTSGAAAVAFYRDVLDDRPLMLLPGGTVLSDTATVLQAMSGPPWSRYELDDLRVIDLTEVVSTVFYGVTARRASAPEYSALVASTYVRRQAGWRLAVHQQTPR